MTTPRQHGNPEGTYPKQQLDVREIARIFHVPLSLLPPETWFRRYYSATAEYELMARGFKSPSELRQAAGLAPL